jgi:hypothetical protein
MCFDFKQAEFKYLKQADGSGAYNHCIGFYWLAIAGSSGLYHGSGGV